jgi:DNA polymerase III alpha subunit
MLALGLFQVTDLSIELPSRFAVLICDLREYTFSGVYIHALKAIRIKPMYIHLTAHSGYSLQEGLLTPADLVQAAQANGMSALGLTDRNLLTGAIEFASACTEANMQPLIGLEIHLNDGPLSLLAMSCEGWSNLCRLSSAIALRDNSDASCSLDVLASYSNGLIALSSHPEQLTDIFPNCLYINLQDPSRATTLSKLALGLNLPTVVTHPIYYLTPDQAALQRTLAAVRLNRTITTLLRRPMHTF